MLFLQLLQVLLFLYNLVLNVRCANIIVSRESPSEILTWTHGHKKCMISLSSVGKGSVNHRDSNHCHDASYYKQIKSYFLSHPSNNDTYKSRLFDAIVNLYDDLRLAHLPVNVSVPPYGGGRYALVHPISFSFPDSAILNSVPAKDQSLGSVIPGKKSTYIWDEQKYYDDLQRSLFVLTVKKAGWDCFRHNEVLSSGSLPLFIDISGCPSAALGLHPKKLYSLLLSFPGLLRGPLLKGPSDYLESPQQLSVDWGQFDEAMYRLTAQALLQYTRNVLSCERVASYLLDVVAASSSKRAARNSSSTVPIEPMQQLRGSGVDSSNFNYTSSYTGRRARRDSSPFPHSILFLTHRSLGPGDYMVELLLLGLKNIMDPAHVLDFPRRNCIYRDTGQFNRSAYLEGKQHLYGGGFTFGYRLEDVLTDSDRAEAAVLQRLKRKEFDLIVVPSAHIDMLAPSSSLPFWDTICELYDPSDVAVVDGGDDPMNMATLYKFSACAQHVFSREGFVLSSESPHTREGVLLKEMKGKEIFLMEAGLRRPFASAQAFIDRGFEFGNVTSVHWMVMANIPLGPPIT